MRLVGAPTASIPSLWDLPFRFSKVPDDVEQVNYFVFGSLL